MARGWLESDGALTEAGREWLRGDNDEFASALRREWGNESESNLASVLDIVFSGSIDPTLISAFEVASPEEQLAGLRLLLKVSRKQRRR